jgi:hypothetical protein
MRFLSLDGDGASVLSSASGGVGGGSGGDDDSGTDEKTRWDCEVSRHCVRGLRSGRRSIIIVLVSAFVVV